MANLKPCTGILCNEKDDPYYAPEGEEFCDDCLLYSRGISPWGTYDFCDSNALGEEYLLKQEVIDALR